MKNAKNAKIKIVTKESLISLLETKDKSLVLGRALIALFARQTKDEQKDNATEEYNGIGFTGADGRSGSITAKYFMKHGKLEQWQIDRWMRKSQKTGMPRICKYANQLNQIACERLLTNKA